MKKFDSFFLSWPHREADLCSHRGMLPPSSCLAPDHGDDGGSDGVGGGGAGGGGGDHDVVDDDEHPAL